MYEHRSAPLLPRGRFIRRLVQHGGLIVVLLSVSLAAGMVGYHALARMTWVDAFLNAAMILGGMGPVGTLPGGAAKVFAGCYALYSGVLLIVVAGIMIAPSAHRLVHRLHADARD